MFFRFGRWPRLSVHELDGAVLKGKSVCSCVGEPVLILMLEPLWLRRSDQVRQCPHVARKIFRLVVSYPSRDMLSIVPCFFRQRSQPASNELARIVNLSAGDGIEFFLQSVVERQAHAEYVDFLRLRHEFQSHLEVLLIIAREI